MTHRGPDDEGEYVDANLALGHRRLSIIDLSAYGHQPMSTPNGKTWITYNGEIYNYRELRRAFRKQGFRFQSQSDTEVILAAYTLHGEAFLNDLNGMFALAIWDSKEKKVILARDRVGKKPLFYFHDKNRLVFASEMKAILTCPTIPRELDMEALNLYFTYGYIPAPWTIFRYIRKVREASYVVFKNDHITEKNYWNIPTTIDSPKRSEDDYAEELEALLQEAVRCRMISDVPLGAFLSGGVDSSAVVTMMAKCSNAPVRTFTIDFAEQAYSEGKDAESVARHCETEHEIMQVKTDAINLLPKLVWHFDEPFADSSAIPTYYVSQMARQRVTVILSGDGGDEMFAGYNSYLKKDDFQHIRTLPSGLRKKMLGPLANALPLHAPGRNALKFMACAGREDGAGALGVFPYIKDDLLTGDMRIELQRHRVQLADSILKNVRFRDKLPRLQYLDARLYLPGDILVKVDRMSMANSLETRAPLLDYRVMEFAAQLPVKLRIQNGTTKYLLKKVLHKHIPAHILYKKKQGFAVPVKDWFATTLNGFTKEILLDNRFIERGLFKAGTVENVLNLHQKGRQDYSTWIWMLLCLELWFLTFVDAPIHGGGK